MPRYFFNIQGTQCHHDLDGEEFPHIHAAWRRATRSCGQMISEIDQLNPGHELELQVTDEFANPLYGIHVRIKSYI
jgi:hypothetical protein